eukprot:TRINITY_DN2907_c0_g1_i1.p1 TRINITY_DN2907_c0_g1~~TRINITY_DN2907_c0_g1_i1.p1  ORF type:complete len:595 (+),score=123.05 TRINITY_DN2907_c0_g1_i1:606-2390(+)
MFLHVQRILYSIMESKAMNNNSLPLGEGESESIRFAYLAGLVPKKSILRFKMMIYRKTRGNAITIIENVLDLDPELLETARNKSIYVIVFQESEAMRGGIVKICEAFDNGVYDLNMDIKTQIERTAEEGKECKRMLKIIKEELCRKLQDFVRPVEGSNTSLVEHYRWFFEREYIIYANINLFRVDRTWFKGFCWCPVKKRDQVVEAISNLKQQKKLLCTNLKEVPNYTLKPPTLFRSNVFISPFSSIVETYGVASYREINPTVFTIITFPFLFGVMFGDLAHGSIITAFSLYLVLCNNSLQQSDSLVKPLLRYRYLLLLSGFFSTFGGLITNDFAGFPLYLTSSCFTGDRSEYGDYYTRAGQCVYPLGIDPRWVMAGNGLQYLNSYRMKLGILLGIAQMLLGVGMKGLNLVYFNKQSELLLSFVPQALLIVTFLGYMGGLIVAKWLTDWSSIERNPPSIITCIISIFITGENAEAGSFLGDLEMQATVNKFLFGTICLSVIAMLIMMPLYLFAQRYAEANAGLQEMQARPYQPFMDSNEIKEDTELYDKCLESLIDSIEFILGLFSSTASYLSLIHICRCRRYAVCRSRWSPYH